MDEFQLYSNFNSFMISNALYLAGVSFLIWVTFRAGLRIYDHGAPILNKILVSIFGIGVVYNGLTINAFLQVTWENTAYALSKLDSISENAQSFVDFIDVSSVRIPLLLYCASLNSLNELKTPKFSDKSSYVSILFSDCHNE